MNRKYDQTSPPDCATLAGAIPGSPAPAFLAGIDLAAEAAAREAGRVSEKLAAGMLSLTNLKPDIMPRLLRHP